MKTSKFIKLIGGAVTVAALSLSVSTVQAQPSTLDQLLKVVEDGKFAESKENRQREARFRAEKAQQERLLAEAKAERTRLEQLSERREKQFEDNEKRVAEAEARKRERLGTLNELFGHITSAAGDFNSDLETSLVSTQYPGREEFVTALIEKLAAGNKLPSIEEIERLWFEYQREMTEQGKVVSFDTTVAKPNGEQVEQRVVRVGSYNVVSADGSYLQMTKDGGLKELARQPSGQYQGWANDLANSPGGLNAFGADPTGPLGGSYLSALIASPTIEERWHQGNLVGYAISVLFLIAVLIAVVKFIQLIIESAKVSSQLKSSSANTNNSLGRILKVAEDNPTADAESLELKLNEAILKELPKIESWVGSLKIIAAVAPLMGLLGTVTGMIMTFQAITIFGAGDPQAMAGGISSALVTTVLGLVCAIPTVLMHTFINGRAQSLIHVLEEQSAGIIAEQAES